MRIVSPLLKRVVYPALASARVFSRISVPGLAIVTYHGLMPPGYERVDSGFDGNLISAAALRNQLRLLKAHYNIISPENLLAWRQGDFQLPQRAVLITCDDGLLNCLTDMLPVLRDEGVKCLFFVTGASASETRTMLWYEDLFLMMLNAPAGPFEISDEGVVLRGELRSREQRRATWWSAVKRLSQIESARRLSFVSGLRRRFSDASERDLDEGSVSCRRFGMMIRSELRELAAAGMTIGAHTMSHPMLSQMSGDLAWSEISDSRAKLELAIERKVWAFAYPFGDAQSVTPEILAMPQKAGFDAAFLNYGGGLGTDLAPFALPRVHVTAEMGLSEFEAHVSGFYAGMQRKAGRAPQTLGMAQAAK